MQILVACIVYMHKTNLWHTILIGNYIQTASAIGHLSRSTVKSRRKYVQQYIYVNEPVPCFIMKRFNKSRYNYELTNKSMNITLTSYWGRMRLKSAASQLFTQPFIRAQIKENIKAPRHKWPVTRKVFPFDDVIMYITTSYITGFSFSYRTGFVVYRQGGLLKQIWLLDYCFYILMAFV